MLGDQSTIARYAGSGSGCVSADFKWQQKRQPSSHAERRFQRRHTPHRSAEKNESGTRDQDRTQRGLQAIDLSSSAVQRIRNVGNRLRLVFGWDGGRSRAVVGPYQHCHATK